jgi:hypothetical protein
MSNFRDAESPRLPRSFVQDTTPGVPVGPGVFLCQPASQPWSESEKSKVTVPANARAATEAVSNESRNEQDRLARMAVVLRRPRSLPSRCTRINEIR